MRRIGARAPSITLVTRHGLALQVSISLDEVGTAMHDMADIAESVRTGSDPELHEGNWEKVASTLEGIQVQAGAAAAQLRQRIPLLLRTTAVLDKILKKPLGWRMSTVSNDEGWWTAVVSALLPKGSDVAAIEASLTRTFPRIFRVRR